MTENIHVRELLGYCMDTDQCCDVHIYINNVPIGFPIEELDYDRYEIECSNHNIYSDGSVYLSECKVNDKKIKYVYGEIRDEIKEGKKVNIYKVKIY